MVNEDEMRVDAGGAMSQAPSGQPVNEASLRKENIKRTFFSGKGRIAIFGVGFAFLLMLGFGISNLLGSGSSTPSQAAPTNAMPNAGGLSGDRMATSAQEMEMRRRANAQAASEAAAKNVPYVASPVLMADEAKHDQDAAAWGLGAGAPVRGPAAASTPDRKSTRLNSSHSSVSRMPSSA